MRRPLLRGNPACLLRLWPSGANLLRSIFLSRSGIAKEESDKVAGAIKLFDSGSIGLHVFTFDSNASTQTSTDVNNPDPKKRVTTIPNPPKDLEIKEYAKELGDVIPIGLGTERVRVGSSIVRTNKDGKDQIHFVNSISPTEIGLMNNETETQSSIGINDLKTEYQKGTITLGGIYPVMEVDGKLFAYGREEQSKQVNIHPLTENAVPDDKVFMTIQEEGVNAYNILRSHIAAEPRTLQVKSTDKVNDLDTEYLIKHCISIT